MLPTLIMLSTLSAEVALEGESIACADLNLSTPGIYSLLGDNEAGLYVAAVCPYEGMPIRRPESSSAGDGEGGVGVRGGAGIGRLEAIAVFSGPREHERMLRGRTATRRWEGEGTVASEPEVVDSRGYR